MAKKINIILQSSDFLTILGIEDILVQVCWLETWESP